jgi:hypothetical protein
MFFHGLIFRPLRGFQACATVGTVINGIKTRINPKEIRGRSVQARYGNVDEPAIIEITDEAFDPNTEMYTLEIGLLLSRRPSNVKNVHGSKVGKPGTRREVDLLLTQQQFDTLILPFLPIKKAA